MIAARAGWAENRALVHPDALRGHERPCHSLGTFVIPSLALNPAIDDARELIQRVARGDRRAFEEVYDRYSPLIFGLLVRMTRDRAQAEEILGEVFWRAWRDAGAYDPRRGSPEAWLIVMARSRALDAMRSARRITERLGGEMPATVVDSARGPAESLEARQLIIRAVGELASGEREALELAYFDGLTQTEIAARTGVPLGTVKSRIRSGLDRLRTALVTKGWDT